MLLRRLAPALVLLLVASTVSTSARAQETQVQQEPQEPKETKAPQEPARSGPDLERLQRLRADKLGMDIFKVVPWGTDYDAARERAKAKERVLLVYFTRSDMVVPACEEVEADVLAHASFPKLIADVELVVHVWSRLPEDSNLRLMPKLGVKTMPQFAIVDPAGRVLARPERTLAGIEAGLTAAKRLFALRKELLLLELQWDSYDKKTLAGRADGLLLTEAEQALLARKLVDAEMTLLLDQIKDRGREEVAAAIATIAKAGRRPSELQAPTFWLQVLQHAARGHEAELARQAYGELEARIGKHETDGAQRQMARFQQLLQEAESKPK